MLFDTEIGQFVSDYVFIKCNLYALEFYVLLDVVRFPNRREILLSIHGIRTQSPEVHIVSKRAEVSLSLS